MFKCKDCGCGFEEPQTKRKVVQVVNDWWQPYTDVFAFDCCPECESENIEEED